ncbi:MAG: polysaccharide deacetylase family protein [Clostridium sp.]|uniref:polysaccharide deacetylase family protein n=1 Tax=Clostridium sp. TaxID=1506 RepID=UPI003F351460
MKRKIYIIGIMAIIITFLELGIKYNLVDAINLNEKEPIYKIETEEKELFLTFDINWAEEDNTYKILEILKKNNVKGTFFIMGKWVIYPDGNKEKLKKIYEEGHLIGNHSYVHPDFKNISKERMKEEIIKTEEIINKEIGIKTNIFRFPSGSFSKEAIQYVYDLNYVPMEWNIDSKDWLNEGAYKEYLNVKNKIGNGSIILYHNNGKYTPENLEKIIKECKKEGYTFKTLTKIQ